MNFTLAVFHFPELQSEKRERKKKSFSPPNIDIKSTQGTKRPLGKCRSSDTYWQGVNGMSWPTTSLIVSWISNHRSWPFGHARKRWTRVLWLASHVQWDRSPTLSRHAKVKNKKRKSCSTSQTELSTRNIYVKHNLELILIHPRIFVGLLISNHICSNYRLSVLQMVSLV